MPSRQLGVFIGRRLLTLAVLLLVLSFAVFSLMYLAPGSPIQVLLGSRPTSPELLQALREEFHLDRSFLEQYWLWLSSALQLDFGRSIRTGQAVSAMIGDRAPVTFFMAGYACIASVIVGVPLGILAAVRSRTALDRGIVGVSVVGVSAPVFVTGIVLLYVFAVMLGWFPTYGAGEGFADRVWHMTLPAIALAFTAVGLTLKLTRAAMVNVLGQDYVGFALARGVPMRRVLIRYALRNALVPIVTAVGMVITVVLTGAVLVETTFSLPGLGTLLVDAVKNKDVPVLQGATIVIAAVILFVNLVVDVVYVFVDPRIGFEAGAS